MNIITEPLHLPGVSITALRQVPELRQFCKGKYLVREDQISGKCLTCGQPFQISVSTLRYQARKDSVYTPLCGTCVKKAAYASSIRTPKGLVVLKDNPEFRQLVQSQGLNLYEITPDTELQLKCRTCGKIEAVKVSRLYSIYAKGLTSAEFQCPYCIKSRNNLRQNFRAGVYQCSQELQDALINKDKLSSENLEEIDRLIPEDFSLEQKVQAILHQNPIKRCPICGRPFIQTHSQLTCADPGCRQTQKKRTCQKLYGGNAPASSKKVREKAAETCLKKYGVRNPFEDTEWIKASVKAKWGVENIFQRTDYIQRKVQEKLGVSNPTYLKVGKEVQEILQNKEAFLKFYNQNPGPPRYIGNLLGVSGKCITDKFHEFGLESQLQPSRSSWENILEKQFQDWGLDFQTNVHGLLPDRELDFYFPERRLGVEFNGNYWHSDAWKDSKYHQDKSLRFQEQGIRVIHIYEYEWLDPIQRSRLLGYLQDLFFPKKRIFARKCTVKQITSQESRTFLEKYHLQGSARSSVQYGLFLGTELLEVMTFSKPRFKDKIEWELIRLCTKTGYQVIGGASRLLKAFEKENQPKSLVSYCNIDKMQGGIYSRLGFQFSHLSAPNYVWVKGSQVKTRYQCQKSKLLTQGYTGNSETEIMHSLGYQRTYDAGNQVWEKVYN